MLDEDFDSEADDEGREIDACFKEGHTDSDGKGIYTGGYSQCEQGFGGKGRDGGFFFPKRFVDHLTT